MKLNQQTISLESISKRKPPFWNLSRLGIFLACLFFVVPLCSLPPTRMGYYSQIESSFIAFWSLSGFSSLWLYFLWDKNPGILNQSSRLPIVWGPILLGITTILLSPFHPLPLKDFVGSPHIGEGVLTFIASGIMACHLSILARIPVYRKSIFIMAALVGLVISTLTIIGAIDSPIVSLRYWDWAPFLFPDFLAFIDIALISAYLFMRPQLRGSRRFNDLLAFSVFAIIGYYASNKCLGYGLIIGGISTLGIWFFPPPWRRGLLQISFFSLSFTITILITFYDEFSKILPGSLASFGHLSTIMSRTWLSKVILIDLWNASFNWEGIQQLLIGKGWGTFNNIATSNMFQIDQVSLFSGKEYKPSWELVNRDLLHTHNVLTNFLHSLGLVGIGLYLFTQHKLIHSLSQRYFFLGAAFLIIYQVQVLFWFQFLITIPFSLFAFSLLFKKPSHSIWSSLFRQKYMLLFAGCLLTFATLQGVITIGYQMGLKSRAHLSHKDLVAELLSSPYLSIEAAFGAQRQVALSRIYATALQSELAKEPPELVAYSLKLVNHLKALPRDGNYLANNLAINILSELASKPETLKLLNTQAFNTWEQLTKDHITLMPYRTDILLPFFNLYQTLGKEAVVLEFTKKICEKNPNDPIALWFMGSSLLKNPVHFDTALCILQKSIREGIERFMPVPPILKTKIILHARVCPQNDQLLQF